MSMISQDIERFSPDALLLDMDGLMVDSEPLWFRVETAFCAMRGGTWTEAQARSCTGKGTREMLRTMGAICGFEIDLERDASWIFDAVIAKVGELELKPGCVELLDAAAGRLPIAVASSSPLRLIEAVLARFDLRSRFGAVISGESVPRPKPAPDIFLRAAAELGARPERCAVFEDSLAGVEAGRAAGMFVVAVPEGSPRGRGFEIASRIVPDLFDARRCLELPSAARR